jgi:hypothetical protein
MVEKTWEPDFFAQKHTLKPLEVAWSTYKFSNLTSIFEK